MDSLYDAQEDAAPESMMDEPSEHGSGEGSGKTALINSEVCPDAEVGEVIQLRVTRKMDKELEVEYVGKGDGDGEEKPPMEEPGPSMSQGESLMD